MLADIAIETSWKTPYAFLERGVGLKLNSVRTWVELDHSDSFERIDVARAIFDYSDLNSPWGFYAQSMLATPSKPGRYTQVEASMARLASKQYNPLLQLGGDGGGVSLQLTFKGQLVPDPGWSDPYLYSIYALSALVQPGSEIF